MPQNTQEPQQNTGSLQNAEASTAPELPPKPVSKASEKPSSDAEAAADAAALAALRQEDDAELEAYAVDLDAPVVVEFKHVFKRYKLYKDKHKRLLGLFFKSVPYKTVEASNDLNFVIRKGESVAFLGHNGAGKSTALKMITGVVFPTEGEVIVNGRVSALLELRAGFDRDLTGRENIRLRGQIWGLTEKQIDKLEPKVIKFADLGDYIDQPLRTYSSGMKARLGFAFASSVNPEILIVDEALSVGDRRFKRKCRRRVNRIMRRRNMTMIFVTHSTNSARKFCERGIVLEHGQVMFDGPIDDAIAFYEHKEDLDEARSEAADRAAGIDEDAFIDAPAGDVPAIAIDEPSPAAKEETEVAR